MTAFDSEKPTPTGRAVMIVLLLVILVTVVLAAVLNPGLLRFWPMSTGEFLQTVAPLLLVSLFIERTLEVFLTTWRGPGAAARTQAVKQVKETAKRAQTAADARPTVTQLEDANRELVRYKSDTQRIAFASGIALGVVISALGVRALALFVDPAVFGELRHLHPVQAQWFVAADVLLTGAVLGGGSDGLHKLISVFTDFLDTTSDRMKNPKTAE